MELPKAYAQQIWASRLKAMASNISLSLPPNILPNIFYSLDISEYSCSPLPLILYCQISTHFSELRSKPSTNAAGHTSPCPSLDPTGPTSLEPLPPPTPQQPQWYFQNIKQNMPLSFLETFSGSSMFYHGLQVLSVQAHTLFMILTHSPEMIFFLACVQPALCSPSPCPCPALSWSDALPPAPSAVALFSMCPSQ